MESIGIIGLSVRDHDAAELARFTIARDDRPGRLPALAAALDATELVYLATCNRVEVVYRGQRPAGPEGAAGAVGGAGAHDPRARFLAFLLGRAVPAEEADRTLRYWVGDGAVEHLFQVAAGLDSALLGEREIQGQIRDALAEARAAGTSGVLVDHLLQEALRVARQVHLRTELGRGRASLAEIAAELLLERVRRTPSPVALVGVSPMTRRCAAILRREGVPFTVVNRTPERAAALVAEVAPEAAGEAGRALSLEAFRRRPPRVEAVLCATASPEPVLDRAALERLAAHTASQEPPLIVDLALPPDVDPEAARSAQVPRVGMDEIAGTAEARRRTREGAAEAARRVVDEALADLKRRLAERALAPVITRIHERYRRTALEGVERLLAQRGFALDAAAREALERWAETLARRFAHLPTRGLRGLAAGHGTAAVRSFLEACDAGSFAELLDEAELLERLARALDEGPGR